MAAPSHPKQPGALGASGSRRVAILAGLRTPFVKAGGPFRDLSALDLGKLVVAELLERTAVRPTDIDQVVFGQVVPSVSAPNIAREIVLGAGMPHTVDAYSVSRACATAIQALTDGANSIATGNADVVV